MSCAICFERFNTRNNKPIILMMCGHTFCSSCIQEVKKTPLQGKCPTCKETIVRERPNYSLLDILEDDGKEVNDSQPVNINTNDLTVPKETNSLFKSPFHEHTLKEMQKDNG